MEHLFIKLLTKFSICLSKKQTESSKSNNIDCRITFVSNQFNFSIIMPLEVFLLVIGFWEHEGFAFSHDAHILNRYPLANYLHLIQEQV